MPRNYNLNKIELEVFDYVKICEQTRCVCVYSFLFQ